MSGDIFSRTVEINESDLQQEFLRQIVVKLLRFGVGWQYMLLLHNKLKMLNSRGKLLRYERERKGELGR